MSRSLGNLSHSLRNLIRSMAGEDPEADEQHDYSEAESDTPSPSSASPADLLTLLESLDAQGAYTDAPGGEDWATEREFEISRLERENAELRKMLGIDAESIAESGVDMDAEITRMDRGRHPDLAARHRPVAHHQRDESGEIWWPANNQQPQQQQQQQQQQQLNGMSGARIGTPRRSAFFGSQNPNPGQAQNQRGGNVLGRGAPPAGAGPPPNPWSAPPAPAPPVVSDRMWPAQGSGGSTLDLSR